MTKSRAAASLKFKVDDVSWCYLIDSQSSLFPPLLPLTAGIKALRILNCAQYVKYENI